MKQYECIKDYHPLLRDKAMRWYTGGDPEVAKSNKEWNESIKLVPTKDPIVVKGDIMTQMGPNDSRFLSTLNPKCALYEYTLQEYSDCFRIIKKK